MPRGNSGSLQGILQNFGATGELEPLTPASGVIPPVSVWDFLLLGGERLSINVQTLTGNLTLTESDALYQYLNSGASDRDVTLPASPGTGRHYIIQNAGATNTLTVKDSAGTTVTTVGVGETTDVVWTGSAWIEATGGGLSPAGQILAIAGSAAAPSYSFASDPNTGIYLVGADSLGVSVGGTVRLTATTTSLTTTLPILAGDGTAAAPSYSFASDPDTGMFFETAGAVDFAGGGSSIARIQGNGIWMRGAAPTLFFGSAADLQLTYDAANVLAQRNATNAQTFRIYGTYTSPAVYQYGGFVHDGVGSFYINSTSNGGGGSLILNPDGAIYFKTAAQYRWTVDSSGDFYTYATTGTYNIGGAANRVKAIYLGGATLTASAPAIDITQTWNAGAVQFTAIKLSITDTASHAASLLLDLQVGGANKFYVQKSGLAVGYAFEANGGGTASNAYFMVTGRGYLAASADGVWGFFDNAGTSFGRLCFGGTTASFPALKRSGATLLCQLADDSNYARFEGSVVVGQTSLLSDYHGGATDGTGWNRSADGVVYWRDAAGTSFGRMCFGGTTASFPSLKRSSALLAARLADDSNYCGLDIGALFINDGQDVTLADASDIVLATTTGTKIGTATGQKLGFWNATPVVQQVLATGAGATVDNVISFLQTIGLCKQS